MRAACRNNLLEFVKHIGKVGRTPPRNVYLVLTPTKKELLLRLFSFS